MSELDSEEPKHIAFYGSLMANVAGNTEARLIEALEFTRKCTIPGCIYDLGEYPGLIYGEGRVLGELYAITDQSVLTELDAFERFFVLDLSNSLYVRESIRLIEPEVQAWVYIYNQGYSSQALVQSGDWRSYYLGKKKS